MDMMLSSRGGMKALTQSGEFLDPDDKDATKIAELLIPPQTQPRRRVILKVPLTDTQTNTSGSTLQKDSRSYHTRPS